MTYVLEIQDDGSRQSAAVKLAYNYVTPTRSNVYLHPACTIICLNGNHFSLVRLYQRSRITNLHTA
jgi:hypothetical protein